MKFQHLILTFLAAITIATGCGGELPSSDAPTSAFPFPGPEVLGQLKGAWVTDDGARRLELRPDGGAIVNTMGTDEAGFWRLTGEDVVFQLPAGILHWRIIRSTPDLLELEQLGTFQRARQDG